MSETEVIEKEAGEAAPTGEEQTGVTPITEDATPAPASEGGEGGEAAPEEHKPSPFYSEVPENWRDDILTALNLEGDAATRAKSELSRVKDLPSAFKRMLDAQEKIRQGQQTSQLPDDATDEQIAEWRAANGVPATHKEYTLDLGEGVVLGENDKALMGSIQEAAHKHNVSNEQMNAIATTFFEAQKAQTERREALDVQARNNLDRTLGEMWGGDKQRNMNIMAGVLQRMPEGLNDKLHTVRGPDGNPLAYDPTFLNYILDLEMQANPTVTIAPDGGASGIATVQSRIGEIRSIMQNDPDKYWKDEKMQAELRSLFEVEEKLQRNS